METKRHEIFMRRCLDLAIKGRPFVRTNPLVGSCIVHNDKIIGEGYHSRLGDDHGEISAIKSVAIEDKHLFSESTLYVNLAPCHHHGRTPPCSETIIKEKFKQVVIAMPEINPAAVGSVQAMRSVGINVIEKVLETEAKEVNRHFINGIKEKRPFITLKWAESSDGFIGQPAKRIQLTGGQCKMLTHDLRRSHNAILIGASTAIVDRPSLTTRAIPGPSPTRIILSGSRHLPSDLPMFNDGFTNIIVVRHDSINTLIKSDYRIVYQGNRIEIIDLIQQLYDEFEIGFLFVEGGKILLQQFIDNQLFDVCYKYIAPGKLSSGIPAPLIPIKASRSFMLGEDRVVVYDGNT